MGKVKGDFREVMSVLVRRYGMSGGVGLTVPGTSGDGIFWRWWALARFIEFLPLFCGADGGRSHYSLLWNY